MAARYNPPPNWPPPPPGWTPDPDWRPDPEWGPAPPGHQFWIDDEPAAEPGGKPPAGNGLAITALVIAGLALLLSWVPVVNNGAPFIALIALGFGIPALVMARRGHAAGQGMALASIIVAVVSVAVVIGSQMFYSSVLEEVERSLTEEEWPATGPIPSGDADTQGEPEPGQSPSPVPGTRANPLALGEPAKVGQDYRVVVRSVDLDADDELGKTNMFNEPPRGQYVLVTLAVAYLGNSEGDPWLDLSVTMVGSDARQYDDDSCGAVTGRPAIDVPTLEHGGRAFYEVCMDVPPRAVPGGALFVEESLSLNASRIYWSLPRE